MADLVLAINGPGLGNNQIVEDIMTQLNAYFADHPFDTFSDDLFLRDVRVSLSYL